MRRGVDYHIHLFYQRCANETMTMENVVRKAESLGLTSIAITDHVNRPEQLDNLWLIKRDVEEAETDIEILFGLEVNYDGCDGEFVLTPDIREEFGFDLAIGGIHSAYTDSMDPGVVSDIQHRHHLRTLENPLVDVLVHPWWFSKSEADRRPQSWWEALIREQPDDRVTELAQASRAHRSAIEVNAMAIFYAPQWGAGFRDAYVEYLARLRDAGALFSIGSDAHDIGQFGASDYVEGILEGLRVPEEQVWRPT